MSRRVEHTDRGSAWARVVRAQVVLVLGRVGVVLGRWIGVAGHTVKGKRRDGFGVLRIAGRRLARPWPASCNTVVFSCYGRTAAGTGFRYLLARAFGIRAGVDVGWSEEETAVYLTSGHDW